MKKKILKILLAFTLVLLILINVGCNSINQQYNYFIEFKDAENLFNTSKTEMKLKAIEKFEKVGSPDSIEYLEKGLQDTHSRVRAASLEALINLKKEDSYDYIIDALNDSEEMVTIVSQKYLLAHYNEMQAYFEDLLLNESTDKEIQNRKRFAIKAIDFLIKDSFIDLLIKVIETDKNSIIRIDAIAALSKIDHPLVKKYLILFLKNSNTSIIVQALKGLQALDDPQIKEEALPLLDSTDVVIVQETIKTLEKYPDPQSVKKILNRIIDIESTDSELSKVSIHTLSQIGSIDSVQYYLDAINYPNKYLKYIVLQAAKNSIDKTWAEPILVEATQNDDISIKTHAVIVLAEFDTEKSSDQLLKLIYDPLPSVRKSAITSLAQLLTADKYKDVFIELIYSGDYETQTHTIKAISGIKKKWVFNLFQNLIQSNDENYVIPTLKALGNYNDNANAVDLIESQVFNKNTKIASGAVNVLININNPRAKIALVNILERGNSHAKILAIRAIADKGDYSFLDNLKNAWTDDDKEVQDLAMQVYKSIYQRKIIKSKLSRPIKQVNTKK